MHPIVWMFPIVAAVGVTGYVLWQMHQEHLREQAYREPFERAANRAGDEEFERRIMQELLREVEPRLQDLRRQSPGRERTRNIRALRAAYHPDRHANTPFMQQAITQISGIINDRTEILLREDASVSR